METKNIILQTRQNRPVTLNLRAREKFRHCEGGNGLPTEAIRLINNIFGKITPHPLFKKNFLPLTRFVCEANRYELLTSHFSREGKRYAFTLAEVLITLGIIGVVAAITIPSTVNSFRKKSLEVQYKKSVSIISQAILNTKTDMGIDRLAEYCLQVDAERTEYINSVECYDYLYKNTLKIMHSKKAWGAHLANINRNGDSIKTYNSKQTLTETTPIAGYGYTIFYTNLMPDGSFLNYWVISYSFYIGVDTNGKRPPNKLGHDIFVFTLDQKKDTLTFLQKPQEFTDEEIEQKSYEYEYQKQSAGFPCSLTSTQKGNGIGCSWYALRDECPYDSSRRYFECLP